MAEKNDKKTKDSGRKALRTSWYEGQNKEIVVYYLIAVAFLELIVGAVAFFYGVVHAVPITPGGPRMANFPWVGWLIAALLSPVALLLILHLSGQFFSRSLNATSASSASDEKQEGATTKEGKDVVPERVRSFYTIMQHAPTIVILLGLIALGAALFFVDSALDVLRDIGQALMPYLPWVLGSIVTFLVVCYLGRLWFISRHKRMEQEYAYRMQVLEKTGIIITSEGCTPLRLEENGMIQLLESGKSVMKELPVATVVNPETKKESSEEILTVDAKPVEEEKK